jgi:hypothetical protein
LKCGVSLPALVFALLVRLLLLLLLLQEENRPVE